MAGLGDRTALASASYVQPLLELFPFLGLFFCRMAGKRKSGGGGSATRKKGSTVSGLPVPSEAASMPFAKDFEGWLSLI